MQQVADVHGGLPPDQARRAVIITANYGEAGALDRFGAPHEAFLHATGDFVAQVYLGPVDWQAPAFEVGYIADCQHEGKGFVTEAVNGILAMAFDHLGAHRITLRTDETNTRSQLVAQHCGFVLEGQLRHAHRNSNGSFTTDLLYGLIRD